MQHAYDNFGRITKMPEPPNSQDSPQKVPKQHESMQSFVDETLSDYRKIISVHMDRQQKTPTLASRNNQISSSVQSILMTSALGKSVQATATRKGN